MSIAVDRSYAHHDTPNPARHELVGGLSHVFASADKLSVRHQSATDGTLCGGPARHS